MTKRPVLYVAIVLAITLTASGATDVTYTYDLLGRLVFVHRAGGNTIHYVYDAAGNRTQVSTASTNYAPLAFPDLVGTDETVAITFDPRINDQDPEGDTLTISAKTNGAHGTVTLNGGTSLTYTPTGYYNGPDSFTYTISDGHANAAVGTVAMTVNFVNQPPAAANDSITTNHNTPYTFDPRTNDGDPENDPITITAKTNGSHGTVMINGGTSVTYNPTHGYSGSDSFTYTISDGHAHAATATVSVTVTAINQPPVAVDDGYTVAAGTKDYTYDPRTNDSDVDDDALTITAVSSPTLGTVTINSGTSLTSHLGLGGIADGAVQQFTYTISDGHGHTATATVAINGQCSGPTC